MNCKSAVPFVKAGLFVLSVAVLLLSVAGATNAKSKVNSSPSDSPAKFVNKKEVKRILIRLTGRNAKGNSRGTVSLPAACNCTAAPDEFGGIGCFRKCLTDWGVSYASLITCGGVCGLAATGNPIGIAVCAACVGTAEWIVGGCVLHCILEGNRWGLLETVRSRHRRPQGLQQAKRILKRATST